MRLCTTIWPSKLVNFHFHTDQFVLFSAHLFAVDELMVKEEEVSLLWVSFWDLVQLSWVDHLCAHIQNVITLHGWERGRSITCVIRETLHHANSRLILGWIKSIKVHLITHTLASLPSDLRLAAIYNDPTLVIFSSSYVLSSFNPLSSLHSGLLHISLTIFPILFLSPPPIPPRAPYPPIPPFLLTFQFSIVSCHLPILPMFSILLFCSLINMATSFMACWAATTWG